MKTPGEPRSAMKRTGQNDSVLGYSLSLRTEEEHFAVFSMQAFRERSSGPSFQHFHLPYNRMMPQRGDDGY